jgi:hypothetical protein
MIIAWLEGIPLPLAVAHRKLYIMSQKNQSRYSMEDDKLTARYVRGKSMSLCDLKHPRQRHVQRMGLRTNHES